MLTADLSLLFDPEYEKIPRRLLADQAAFEDAFARAWFKLTHRDMGPCSWYLGPEVPKEDLLWQDPIPALNHELVNAADIENLKKQILESGLSTIELIETACASASTFLGSYKRGGTKGSPSQ